MGRHEPQNLCVGSSLRTPDPPHAFLAAWKIPDTIRGKWPLKMNELRMASLPGWYQDWLSQFPRGQEF
ncbi:hypothetical protein SBV1_2560014 [Verrucomicrobia bacterium]|nr:hypothetical protein SBV1_2560014 [Verrucomicrobiota bacterium]